jgi:hypothetical protein
MSSPIPPAGWYPLDGMERWWDGQRWTAESRPLPHQTPPLHQTAVLPYPGQLAPSGQPGYPQHQSPMVPQGPVFAQGPTAAGGIAPTDQRVSTVEVTFAWIITLLTLGYMLPWAIAATRGKSNSLAIGVLNLLLGWTFVGWVVSLVMACGAHQHQLNMVQLVHAPTYYPPQPPNRY